MKCPFTTEWLEVTPALARTWLDTCNSHNRPLREVTVSAFIADMLGNRWSPNHQPIAFGASGVLLDGQHRLAAIAHSGKAQWLLVVRGVPERVEGIDAKVMETIDRGNSRSLADLLRLDHGMKAEAPVVAAACLHIARLCVESPDSRAKKASMPQTVGVLELYREELKWLCKVRPTTTGMRNIVIVGTLAFVRSAMPAVVDDLYSALLTGAGLAGGSAALVMRNAVLSGSLDLTGSAINRVWTASILLECLVAHQAGRSWQRLPRPAECADTLRRFVARDPRVARVAALFPATGIVGVRRMKKGKPPTLAKPRATASAVTPPPPAIEPVKAATWKPTPAAQRLLARAGGHG